MLIILVEHARLISGKLVGGTQEDNAVSPGSVMVHQPVLLFGGSAAGACRTLILEALHYVEIKNSPRVRKFHLVQSFHVKAAGRKVAYRANVKIRDDIAPSYWVDEGS
jgi:hypothetical protein